MGRYAKTVPPLGLTLDPSASLPLYAQIAGELQKAILERRLSAGATLPSSRLLARELNCARGTVMLALDQLISEGYVVSRAGSGMIVSPNLPDEMLASPKSTVSLRKHHITERLLPRRTQLLLDVPSITGADHHLPIAFPIGQPDRQAFPFALWARLLEREWRNPGWKIAGSPHPFGHSGLREAIATYLGISRGFPCDPRSIVVTTGIRQSVSLFARIALEAGDEAWVEEPGYPGLRQALGASNVHAVGVPVDEFGFSSDAAFAVAPKARLAIVAPSHQFPLGTVMTLQRRLSLLSWAERTGGWILEDDFDAEYRYSGRPLSPLRALDRSDTVAYSGSFSKLLFPALRLSFLVLPTTLIAATERLMAQTSARASQLGQGALARFIEDGHFASHLRRTRVLYGARQRALVNATQHHLKGLLSIAPDPGGMHLVARPDASIMPYFDDQRVTATAARANVAVTPLSVCYASATKVHGLLLGYAGTPENEMEPSLQILRKIHADIRRMAEVTP